MKPKKEDKSMYIVLMILVIVMVLFTSLHMGYNYANAKDQTNYSMAKALSDSSVSMTVKPFAIFPIHRAYFQYTGMMLTLSVLGVFMLLWEEVANSHANSKTAQGSAKWNTNYNKYNKRYSDPPKSTKHNGPKNLIESKNVFLNMDTRKTFLNNNVLIIGGSGSGKTRYQIKPNILQANCSYCVTDPSGEIIATTGAFLEKEGYKIKVFNLVDMQKSDCYNPFRYIRDDNGVIQLINCLIKNTNNGQKGGDPFWEKSETALLQAIIFYLINHRPKEEQNFSSVMKLLHAAAIQDEDNPNAKSPLDLVYDGIAAKDPNDIGLKAYRTFKMGAGKTLKSILISCAVRLNVFNISSVRNLTDKDTIDLGSVGDEKTALFIIIPAADDTFNFLVSMMYSQLFETLYYHAEKECPNGFYIKDNNDKMICFKKTEMEANAYLTEHSGYKKVKGSNHVAHHVRFMLDEFANIGLIPDFEKKLATMRKYELSCTIILQNLAQLKNLYKDANEDIIGNCDSTIFLGGKSYETLQYLSNMLGKTTIRVKNSSRNHGKGGASSSFNTTGRELMTPNELSLIPSTKCLVMIRGLDPFFDDKYDYTKHPNYEKTGDAKKELIYNITLDNSACLTNEDIDRMTREEVKAGGKEFVGDTKTAERFVKDNDISPSNPDLSVQQPKSSEHITPQEHDKYVESRRNRNKSVGEDMREQRNKNRSNKDVLINKNKKNNNRSTKRDVSEIDKCKDNVKRNNKVAHEDDKSVNDKAIDEEVNKILHEDSEKLQRQFTCNKNPYDVAHMPPSFKDNLDATMYDVNAKEQKFASSGKAVDAATTSNNKKSKEETAKKKPVEEEVVNPEEEIGVIDDDSSFFNAFDDSENNFF